MIYDAKQDYDDAINHLVTMANLKGWKAYSWHRAQELAQTINYRGIDIDLKQKMQNAKTNAENAGNEA